MIHFNVSQISALHKHTATFWFVRFLIWYSERWNRTIKTRIERFFSEINSKRWIDILEQFTHNINRTKNRTIGIEPVNVTLENAAQIFKRLHPEMRKPKDCKLKVGNVVRTAIEGNVFKKVTWTISNYCKVICFKGYHQNWSTQLYIIESIKKSQGFCLYRLRKRDGEILERYYYLTELNFVSNAFQQWQFTVFQKDKRRRE